MKLRDLISVLEGPCEISGAIDQVVSGLAWDSRRVRPGDLFVAIAGENVDAHQFVSQALTNGAVAVVSQKPVEVPPQTGAFVVPDARLALSVLSDRFYGSPSRQLKIAGITGTNGKTTVAFLLKAIAEATGRKVGVIGTAGMLLGSEVLEAKSDYTTPEAPTLHRLLATMLQHQADVVAMEVTSHALSQHRVAHCRFDVAVYTNLTHDHLDYHENMESYFAAKAGLFRMLKPGACAVINLDDPYGERMIREVPIGVHLLTYGFSQQAAVRAEEVCLTGSGVRYILKTPIGETSVEAPYLFGAYNVSNALAAIGAGMALGYGMSAGVEAMRQTRGAPGRFEWVECGQDFTVIVDYAHTPDGFEKLLTDVIAIKRADARLTLVFGSAGLRDQTKRPAMGRIAGTYCDRLVLTEEDPRSEPTAEICRQIASGVQHSNVEILQIEDRYAAIEQAILTARSGDIILIVGKGNETGQDGGRSTNWHGDVPAAEEILRRLLNTPHIRAV